MQANEKKVFESSEEAQEMTNSQFNAFLETIAKRILAEAKTTEQAAEIVREAKVE